MTTARALILRIMLQYLTHGSVHFVTALFPVLQEIALDQNYSTVTAKGQSTHTLSQSLICYSVENLRLSPPISAPNSKQQVIHSGKPRSSYFFFFHLFFSFLSFLFWWVCLRKFTCFVIISTQLLSADVTDRRAHPRRPRFSALQWTIYHALLCWAAWAKNLRGQSCRDNTPL